ncbi:MAG: hypothetical protein AAGG38_08950, partial [Planctomycetota bacterium]
MKPHSAPPLLALALIGLAGLAAGGCASAPVPRESLAPSYSFMQDPQARAEVELWPVSGERLASGDAAPP